MTLPSLCLLVAAGKRTRMECGLKGTKLRHEQSNEQTYFNRRKMLPYAERNARNLQKEK
jgi:hypothetical protein